MLAKHKQPSLEVGLLITLVVISIFSFGFLSENRVTGMAKITGMATTEEIEKANEKALQLYNAMKWPGTDPNKIFTTLESIEGKEEMENVENSFEVMTGGETLDNWLKWELSYQKETRALYLVEWVKSDKEQRGVEKAGDLIDAMDTYIGTDESKVHDVLEGIDSKQEMEDIETSFESMTGETLESWITYEMSGTDEAKALSYISIAKQKPTDYVEYFRLKRNADGISYSREGYKGNYYLQSDGSIFYEGGKNPQGEVEPAQTFKDGKWDTTKSEPLIPIESLTKLPPTIDMVGTDFIVKKVDGTEVYKGKDADEAYAKFAELKKATEAEAKPQPSINKVGSEWIVKKADGTEVYKGTDPNAAFTKLAELKETVPTTPKMNYQDSKELLQGAGLWIDPATQANIETRLPEMETKIRIMGAEIDKKRSEAGFQEETIKLAEAYAKWKKLDETDTSSFDAKQLEEHQAKLRSASAELKAQHKALEIRVNDVQNAIKVYNRETYSSTQANIDLRDPNKKEEAIEFYRQVASGERKDLAGLTKEQALEKLRTVDEAKEIVKKIDAENTAKLRIEQFEKENPDQKGKLIYREGGYLSGGEKGDDFYYDPVNKKIVLIQKPKAEQTPEEKAKAKEDILKKLPESMRNEVEIDDKGNIINKEDGFVYNLKYTETGPTLEKAGAPDSIFVNGVELKRLENYEITKGQAGAIEGSGVYKGSDGILYDQLKNPIKDGTEISFNVNKGSQENPVNVKTYFKVANGGRQGGETWVKISVDKEGTKNPIELSQDVYKRLGIAEDDKWQYSSDATLQIISKNNKLKASVQQATTGTRETKIITGFDKEGKNPTKETIMQFGNGVDKPATIERNKKYEYVEKDIDGDGEKEKDVRLTTSDEATIFFDADDRMDDLKVITEHSWDDEKREEVESKVTVYDVNGKPVGYGEDYNKDGKITDDEMYGKNSIGEDSTNGKSKNRLETLQSQYESRKWFANLEFKLTQFRGLAGWSQLIFDDEFLRSWREGVDKIFSTLYLGTDYWTSEICSKYIPKDQDGLLTMRTKDRLFDVIAHVEGEKTTIKDPNGTKEYIYKLTFSVRNPENSGYDELKFNVYLYGEKTVQLYSENIKLDEGDSFSRGSGKRKDGQLVYDEEHKKPLVQYSKYNHNKICIEFSSKITNAEGDREDEVCNAIVEHR